ncbi:hypothetical protein K488DRAFT_87810 [Vararia minispora EC-137]|uniref:Uncharacterized protein n=1 Tax=Vararia minispora EC-137 TaxID=1314806 RepID=A0ACB8QFJ9_9AGAM|nr:hypothetical protein K488DRAFT_87810 [Vararia minispora EC-137]
MHSARREILSLSRSLAAGRPSTSRVDHVRYTRTLTRHPAAKISWPPPERDPDKVDYDPRFDPKIILHPHRRLRRHRREELKAQLAARGGASDTHTTRVAMYLWAGRNKRAMEYLVEHGKELDLAAELSARTDIERAILAFVEVGQHDDALRVHDALNLAAVPCSRHFRLVIAIAAALQPLGGSFGDGFDYIGPRREAQAAVSAALETAARESDFTESDLRHFLRALEDHPHTDANFVASIADAFVRARGREHAYTYEAETTEHFVELYEKKEEEKERLGVRNVDFEREMMQLSVKMGASTSQLEAISATLGKEPKSFERGEDFITLQDLAEGVLNGRPSAG